jgi:hypothetical protein
MARFHYTPLLLAIFLLTACTDQAGSDQNLTQSDTLALLPPDPNQPVGEDLSVPPYWNVRLDEPDADVTVGANPESDDIFFVNMTPGWHITTGPAAIFYHPASTATGAFKATADIYLFDPGDRNEGFGMLFGGRDLDSDSLSYSYFLIRNSGEFLVKRRLGDETYLIRDWTPSEAIHTYTDTTTSSVLNSLSVDADAEEVAFSINEQLVSIFSTGEIDADGVVGLRANHELNLHVSDLRVE